MHILITGGLGYLGSSIAHHLHHQGHQVTISTRKLANAEFHDLNGIQIRNIFLDNYESIEGACADVDVVIHASGMNASDCLENPVAALESRKQSAKFLIEIASNKRVKKIIHLSTMHVYGDALSGTINELSSTSGRHPYAQSHLEAERVLLSRINGMMPEIFILRLANIFGAPKIINTNCWDLVVNNFCMQAVKTGKIYIKDARAIKKSFLPMNEFLKVISNILNKNYTFTHGGVINVGNSLSYSLEEMAKRVQSAISKKIKIIYDKKKDYKSDNYSYRSLYLESRDIELSVEKEIHELLKACEKL